MKHTPGQWKADTVVNSEDLHMEVYIPNRTLAYVLHYPNDVTTLETEANARLIAAAPELLEALKVAEAWLSNVRTDPKGLNILVDAMPRDDYGLETLRAAIAKAEGN